MIQYSFSFGADRSINSEALQKNDSAEILSLTSSSNLLLPIPGSPTIQTNFSSSNLSIDRFSLVPNNE